ncbi:MAG: M14 family zinc carboxypeptidase [bacterium]
MNGAFLAILFTLFVAIGSSGQPGWRPGEMEAKVILKTPEDIATLKSLKLMDEPAYGETLTAWVYLIPSELAKLKASGLEYIITNPDLNAYSQHFWDQSVLESYHNYTQMVALADSLATNFPSICKKILLGTSNQDHQLAILKISDNVNLNENEAEIMFDGGLHGDEIMGPEILIRYARELCLGYGTNTTYTDLINNREIWLYYLSNPDGFVSGSRYNANGVDCNRDIGFMWNGEGFSTAPFSQMESRILRQLWLEHNFAVYTNFHGGTEVISYPWSYRSSQPPDYNHINQLASVYSNTSGYYNLGYGQGFNIMYQIFGSTKDFAYGALGQVGWSIEVTQQKQPPSSQITMYYNYNVPAMTEIIKRAGWGIEGVVTDSVTGSPVKAAVFINSFYPVYTDLQLGDFHKYVLPGTYTINVKASGYKLKTVTGIVVPSQGSVIANIQLSPNPKWYACKTLVTNIPYFPSSGNYFDESYVPGIIGPPDSINYSIGRSGYSIIDMGDTIFNGSGNDFKVCEGDGSPEGYYCAVSLSADGPWTDLGAATSTTSFNLSGSSVSEARYIKITDDGDGTTNVNNAGFDLDAIEILTPPLVADFTASNNTPCMGTSVSFTDESSGNPTAWLWQFPGGTPSASTLQNPVNILYSTAGTYDVTLSVMNAFTTVTLTKPGFINVGTLSVSLGSDTTLCPWESVTLDAGNPGCEYLWSNGATTQTMLVDSAGFGMGSHSIWVTVTNSLDCVDVDSITVTIDDCSGVSDPITDSEWIVCPNPNSGTFHIRINFPEPVRCELVNLQGQVVLSARFPVGSGTYEISAPNLAKGIYLLSIKSEKHSLIKKLIIQ